MIERSGSVPLTNGSRTGSVTGTVYEKAGDAHMSGEAELCFEIFAAVLAAME